MSDDPLTTLTETPAGRAALVAGAIRSFPFDDFGMDGVSFAIEDDPEAQEWVTALADAVMAVLPLSCFYSHEGCGFHWHGRDGLDIPMRDGQPICPRCELEKLTATAGGDAVTPEQLEFHVPDPQQRRYWEHRGPGDWRPVVVRVRYSATKNLPDTPFPGVRTGGAAPRNVLVEREDGTMDVRPVRILRTKRPPVREAS